jgi:hypothetical protein
MQLYPSDPGEVDAVQLAQVLDVLTWAPHGQPRPREHRLNLSNYPNPFNAGTQIEFTLARNGAVALRIYNVQGQLVRTLLDETTAAGHHLIRWDGRDDLGVQVASGVYFCRLEHGEMVKAVKMLLVK